MGRPAARASPPDQSWIASLYDDASSRKMGVQQRWSHDNALSHQLRVGRMAMRVLRAHSPVQNEDEDGSKSQIPGKGRHQLRLLTPDQSRIDNHDRPG